MNRTKEKPFNQPFMAIFANRHFLKIVQRLSLSVAIFSAIAISAEAQSYYWIGFTDKNNSVFSTSKPSEFLSAKAIQRRDRQNIPITSDDLPVNKAYIDSVIGNGTEATFVHASKWLNGITIKVWNDNILQRLPKYPFIREVQLTKPDEGTKRAFMKFRDEEPSGPDTLFYGRSAWQIEQLNGQILHNDGYLGEGIHIAVLDAGFTAANKIPGLHSLYREERLLGTRDFVNPWSDIYTEHTHGTMVLSTMAAYSTGELVGTAPNASYWLLRSEDASSEYLVEEDHWVAAIEYADSVGVDIVNSSLGYYNFDLPSMNHPYSDLDGKTTRAARAANMAVARGMLVFASAGNEGNDPWRRIITPADGDSVIAVAAVNRDGVRASFSSVGPAADGAVKPDLAATGWLTALYNVNGNNVLSNGTSFSSPILAGMAACLWQAHRDAPAHLIRKALLLSGHQAQNPDSLLGYGIPDMAKADQFLSEHVVPEIKPEYETLVYPNPFSSVIHVVKRRSFPGKVDVRLIDSRGTTVYHKYFFPGEMITLTQLNLLPSGFWFLQITSDQGSEVHKLIKR